jgi:hypothetical protein
MEKYLDDISQKISRLSSYDAKLAFALEQLENLEAHTGRSRYSEGETKQDYPKFFEQFRSICDLHRLHDGLSQAITERMLKGTFGKEDPWTGPTEKLLCANVNVDSHWRCDALGSRACSGCHLVCYCSVVCSPFL